MLDFVKEAFRLLVSL